MSCECEFFFLSTLRYSGEDGAGMIPIRSSTLVSVSRELNVPSKF